MIGGALIRMPTVAIAAAPSSRTASPTSSVLARAGRRAPALGSRGAPKIASSSPVRRRETTRAKASSFLSSPAAAASSSSFASDLDSLDSLALSTHHAYSTALGDLADGLEEPVQALYLVFLLGFLVVGAYLVVRQVRRKVSEAFFFFELFVCLLKKISSSSSVVVLTSLSLYLSLSSFPLLLPPPNQLPGPHPARARGGCQGPRRAHSDKDGQPGRLVRARRHPPPQEALYQRSQEFRKSALRVGRRAGGPGAGAQRDRVRQLPAEQAGRGGG